MGSLKLLLQAMHRLYRDVLLSPSSTGKWIVRHDIRYEDIIVPSGFEVDIGNNNRILPAIIIYQYLISVKSYRADEVLQQLAQELKKDRNYEVDFCSRFIENKIASVFRLCDAVRKHFKKQEIDFGFSKYRDN